MIKRWRKKEKQDEKDFQGKIQPGSGNQKFKPGDVISQHFLVQSKDTTKQSFSVSKKIWNQIYEEALFKFRIPILSIRIQDLDLYVVSKEDFWKIIREELAGLGSD